MASASAHCSVFSLVASSTTRRTIIVSSKTNHRKNYLRPKILKTLTKPYPPIPPLLPVPQPILCPQEHDLRVEVPAYDTHGGAVGEPEKLEDLRVSDSEATAEHNGVFGNVSAVAIFKYGGIYLVGAFLLQTICSFWILGNHTSGQKDRDLDVSGREKRNFLFDGNGKTVPLTGAGSVFYGEDRLGMEKKIEEIKVMAREARRIELEKKGEEDDKDPEIDDESAVSKEISARLLKLQNRITSNKDSSAALRLDARGSSAAGVAKDGHKNVNLGNEALTFKKRFKFKSPSTKATKTPKGFSGTRDSRDSNAERKDRAGNGATQAYARDATDHAGRILDGDKQVNQQDMTQKNTSSVPLEERAKFVDDKSRAILNHGKNLEETMETPDMKTEVGLKTKGINNGGVQETRVGMSSLEVLQSRDSRELRTQNSKGFVQENEDTGTTFEKDNVQGINGSSRHGLAKKNSAANRVRVKQANTKTDMWWLNLRYVLVILMQRDSNGEGSKGLYSLKFTSKEQEQSDDSYTVAFEDHADANNFCFLLESFFEDLGDFSASAVPMSIQELNGEITSHAKKVVVVKKRQLQLHAGQPLTDVEMALCSIIEQDQSAP